VDAAALRAFILAGGLGTRLRELFPDTPKGLVEFGGMPMLAYQIAHLGRHGVDEVVLCVGHGADEIAARLGDGRHLGVHLTYSREPVPLGTAGALRLAAHLFTSTSFALNGDTYLPLDWSAMARYHLEHASADATLAVVHVDDTGRYGQVTIDEEGRVTGFDEKRAGGRPGLVSAGCYALEPRVLDGVPEGRSVSIEHEVFPALLRAGAVLRAFVTAGPFVDMGTPDGYRELRELLG
jgi:NDP-sugar pyrophosphorylase family protein